MMLTFTFTINPGNQEAVYAGNIEPEQALQILQKLVIAQAVQKAREQDKQQEKEVKQI